jgi:hypothetical protein
MKPTSIFALTLLAAVPGLAQNDARLQQAASAASSTLLKIMVDANSPPSCRLRAADSVLSHAAKAIEIEDIEARVAALEEATQKDKHRR